MKKLLPALFLLLVSVSFAQQTISLFGPRAGAGYLLDSEQTSLKKGFHSAFGWQLEVPYKSPAFTGYGEAGFLLLGVEQGIFYPEAWGYFGMRAGMFGLGIGPAFNPMGIGIGVAPYYQYITETLRVPFTLNMTFIDGKAKFGLLMGFSFL